MPETNGERRAINGVAIRWIHLVVALSVYLLSIGGMYATMRSQLDETRERVKQLEQDAIKDAQFKEFREDIQRRLQRIEDKLDRERSLRTLR